jgi:hypothetical protein
MRLIIVLDKRVLSRPDLCEASRQQISGYFSADRVVTHDPETSRACDMPVSVYTIIVLVVL